jgi:hypothetical protein
MACPSLKIDSNVTGLSYAEEECLKQLPAVPYWRPLEPNSYSDFGGTVTTIVREPISQSRQREKGIISNVEASGGFNQDLTSNNTYHLLQGFFFAESRSLGSTEYNENKLVQSTITAVAANAFNGTNFPLTKAHDLVYSSGFSNPVNNRIDDVDAGPSLTSIPVTGLVEETVVPDTARIDVVGYSFSTTMEISLSGNLVRLSGETMTALGLIPGQWVFLGGDLPTERFVNNVGFARVGSVTDSYLEFDKVSWTPVAETATGNIRIFFGDVLKNEFDPSLIIRKTYNIERTLGNDSNGKLMSEYLTGAVANELTINIEQLDKVNVDFSFIACDNEYRDGDEGVKAGTRAKITPGNAFNTSSDVARVKLSLVDETTSNVEPLFAFATSATITISNNVTPNNAIGVVGAFDTTAGNFAVGGSMEVYFSDVSACKAVRNNSSVTLDICLVNNNYGIIFDIPLMSIGDGRANVTANEPIMLSLENSAARSKFNHTLMCCQFKYLPDIAATQQ